MILVATYSSPLITFPVSIIEKFSITNVIVVTFRGLALKSRLLFVVGLHLFIPNFLIEIETFFVLDNQQ